LEVTLGCPPGEIAENVILTPFMHLKSFSRHVEEATLVPLSPPFFFQGFTATFRGARVTVIRTGVGPSRVGDCISFLSLSGAKNLLFAGAVGSLRPDWALGDFFLPLTAADGEGYTRYLGRDFGELVSEAPEISCSGGLESTLRETLKARGIAPREGRVFTIGSIAAEAPENLLLLRERGFDALEMELSAFFSAARHHGLLGAALTYVSDLPIESSLWEKKAQKEEAALKDAYRLLPELALEFFAALG
jgi:purine-nucleoside phosphorylase